MRLHISMSDEHEAEELDSLYRWLTDDPDIVEDIEIKLGSGEDRPDSMGPDAATITAIISAGATAVSAISSLFAAIIAWRASLPRGTAEVTVTPGPRAASITLSDVNQQSPDQLSALVTGESSPADQT
jgi:hypothetical protein